MKNVASSRLLVGAQVAPLRLVNLQGEAFTVGTPEAGWVHLQFRRYAGCPICNLHLRSFTARIAEIRAAGIREVAVFHSSVGAMMPYQGDLPFDAVADPGKDLYRQFGVEASVKTLLNPAGWGFILRSAIGTKPTSVREGGPLGLPANFLISPDGRIAALKYGEHIADHWSVDELLALPRA
jgi:peroxiredoxin